MEYTKQRILTAVRVILFLFFCGLVMHGQRSVSYANLGEMAAGLVGMLRTSSGITTEEIVEVT